MKLLRYVGYAWIVIAVLGYFAISLQSEHGGGVFSASGFGEIWVIALTCLPGVLLLALSEKVKR